jgi:hypothetical protein
LLPYSSIGLATAHLLVKSLAFALCTLVAFFFGVRTL